MAMATKKDKSIASKTSLNLAIRENTWVKSAWVIPAAVAIVLAALLVGKFAVADRLGQVMVAQREVSQLRQTVADIRAEFADYNEVEEQYNQYTYKDFDRTLADRMDILALIEQEIFPVCTVERLALAEKRLDLSLQGPTLENNSQLINRLEANDLVDEVWISTSTATEENGVIRRTAEMTIILADVVPEGEVAK